MVLSRNQNLFEYWAQKTKIWNINISLFFSPSSFNNYSSLAGHLGSSTMEGLRFALWSQVFSCDGFCLLLLKHRWCSLDLKEKIPLHVCMHVKRLLFSRTICSHCDHKVAGLTLGSARNGAAVAATYWLPFFHNWVSSPWHEGREGTLVELHSLAWIKHGYLLQTPPSDHLYQLRNHSGWHSLCWLKRPESAAESNIQWPSEATTWLADH